MGARIPRWRREGSRGRRLRGHSQRLHDAEHIAASTNLARTLSLSPKAETTRQLSPRAACKLRHTKLAHRLIRGISYSAPVRSVRWNGNRVPARPQTTWFAFFEAQVTTGCCSGWSHPGSVEHEASGLPTLIQTGRLLTSGSCLQFSAPRTPPV